MFIVRIIGAVSLRYRNRGGSGWTKIQNERTTEYLSRRMLRWESVLIGRENNFVPDVFVISQIIVHFRERKLVRIADDLSDTICHIADLAEFLRVMHPDVDMALEAREVLIEMHQEVER